MAEKSVFIAIAYILKSFDISPARDRNGEQIIPPPTYFVGLLTYVPTFSLVVLNVTL